MALKKITFDGASVTSKDDADINFHLFNVVPAGIIQGVGNEVSVSAGNNTITFGSGYLQIYGRRIYMEPNTQISISLDGNRNGYVVVDLNLAQNTLTLTKKEVTSGWPSLVQNNLSTSIGRYEFPIAKYTKTATTLTLDYAFTNARPKVKTMTTLLYEQRNQLTSWVDEYFSHFIVSPHEEDAEIMKYDLSWINSPLEECLFHVRIGRKAVLTFSGLHLVDNSIQTLSYPFFQHTHFLTIEYKDDEMVLYSSATDHKVTVVEVFR